MISSTDTGKAFDQVKNLQQTKNGREFSHYNKGHIKSLHVTSQLMLED